MNLIEKIIKGITEIEFEINPELLKDQPEAFTRGQMAKAFLAEGWTLGDSFSNVDDSSTYIFTHMKFPGVSVRMKARNDTKLVFKRMVLFMPHDKNGSLTPATPSNVSVVTERVKEHFDDLKADDEKGADRQKGVTNQELHDAFFDNGWCAKNVGQSGSLVSYQFKHPKILDSVFHTTYDVSSGITQPKMYLRQEGVAGMGWFDATPDVVSKVTANWIGGSKAKFAGDAAILQEELDAIGWRITASSGTGVTVYEHKGVNKSIEVQANDDGKITKVVLVHGDGSGTNMLIDVESIVTTAQNLSAAGGKV